MARYRCRNRMDVIFLMNQVRLRVLVFMIGVTYQARFCDPKSFGTKLPDFGMNGAESIINRRANGGSESCVTAVTQLTRVSRISSREPLALSQCHCYFYACGPVFL
jgi:hypothetical protein